MIEKNIIEAYKFALAKQDAENASCSEVDTDLNNVKGFIRLLLSFGTAFVVPYLTTIAKFAVHGLDEGFTEGQKQNGFLGGVMGAVRGILGKLSTGSTQAFGGFLGKLFKA